MYDKVSFKLGIAFALAVTGLGVIGIYENAALSSSGWPLLFAGSCLLSQTFEIKNLEKQLER